MPVIPDDDMFFRALKFEPRSGEEVRADETDTDRYHGLAPDGSSETASYWAVVRFYKSGATITRVRFRRNIRWDQRTTGWT